MCDTVVAVGEATKDGSVIFGKNSDREPNEAHNIEYHPRTQINGGEMAKCTYISIPQVEETFEVLLSKPFWMWGCEMGANEFGVTIGNEAVWSKEPYRKVGLLGMDMIRLALERTKTAKDAMNVIISLLDQYGQGGPCGYMDKGLNYHNSYIIADPHEAWVLETADKFWIAEKVQTIRTISNSLSIGNNYDVIHPNLIEHAISKGYCKSEEDFNFAKCFIPSLKLEQMFTRGKKRQACTTELLLQNNGEITPETVMTTLRKHNDYGIKNARWSPSKSTFRSPCRHYVSYIVRDQTTASHVGHLKEDLQVHWVTGTSAPCMSTFKPVFLPKTGIKDVGKLAGSCYDADSLWWHHEKLHRSVLLDYNNRFNAYRHERDELEKHFLGLANELLSSVSAPPSKKDREKMQKITEEAFALSRDKTEKWTERVRSLPIQKKPNPFYKNNWNKLNKKDGLEIK